MSVTIRGYETGENFHCENALDKRVIKTVIMYEDDSSVGAVRRGGWHACLTPKPWNDMVDLGGFVGVIVEHDVRGNMVLNYYDSVEQLRTDWEITQKTIRRYIDER